MLTLIVRVYWREYRPKRPRELRPLVERHTQLFDVRHKRSVRIPTELLLELVTELAIDEHIEHHGRLV